MGTQRGTEHERVTDPYVAKAIIYKQIKYTILCHQIVHRIHTAYKSPLSITLQPPFLLDEVRSLLADSVGRHLRMPSVQDGHDADICHSQVCHALDPELLIHYCVCVVTFAHGTCSRCVVT